MYNKPALRGGLQDTNIIKGESCAGRAALLWKPSSVLSVEAAVYHQKRDQHSADRFDPTVGDPSADQYLSSGGLIQLIHDLSSRPSLTLVFDLGWAELTSLSSNLLRADSHGHDHTLVLPPGGWLSAADDYGRRRADDRRNEPD